MVLTRQAEREDEIVARTRRLEARRHYLLQLRRDLARQEYLGLEPIYALDFSEVMAYVAPIPTSIDSESPWYQYAELFSLRSPDTSLIIDLLGGLETQFFLPVGSVYELREFLRVFFPDAIKGVSRLDHSIENFQGIQTIRALLQEELDSEEGDVRAFIDQKAEGYDSLDRLFKIYVQFCKPARQVLQSVEHVDLDEGAFLAAVAALTPLRPDRPKQNRVDALNFSLVSYLSSLADHHNRVVYLVTRRRPFDALKSIPWRDDPLRRFPAIAATESFSESLVRNVTYLGYAALAALAMPSLDHRMVFVDNLLFSVEENLSALRLDFRQRYFTLGATRRKDGDDLADMFGQLASELADAEVPIGSILTTDEGQLAEGLYNSVLAKLTDDIQAFSALAERARGQGGDFLKRLVDPAVTKIAFSRTTAMGKRLDSWLVQSDTPDRPLGEVHRYESYLEVTTKTRAGRFNWFVSLGSDLYSFMSSIDAINTLPSTRKILPSGFLFTSESKAVFLPMSRLRYPIDADDIWRLAAKADVIPRYVRLSTPYFDLQYSFITRKIEDGSCSLVTHLAVPEVLATFLARTSRRLTPVGEILSEFESFCTTNLTDFLTKGVANVQTMRSG